MQCKPGTSIAACCGECDNQCQCLRAPRTSHDIPSTPARLCCRPAPRRRHRAELHQVAAAFRGVCEGLASVLMEDAPVSVALEQLSAMEHSFSSLSRAGTFTHAAAAGQASQDVVALDMVSQILEGWA